MTFATKCFNSQTLLMFSEILVTLIKRLRFRAIALITVLAFGILSLTPSAAQAATTRILIGSQQGEPAFEPSTVTIKAGDSIQWVNNLAGSACNVVFDAAGFKGIPSPADEDKAGFDQNLFDYLSHKSLIKAANETFEKAFNVPPGEYTYVCTPRQGMAGKVIVK